MTAPDPTPSEQHRGLVSFSFSALRSTTDRSDLQDFAHRSGVSPEIVARDFNAGIAGRKLAGATAEAYITRSSGIRIVKASTDSAARLVHISDASSDLGHDHTVWIRSDASSYDYDISDDRPATAITVPVTSLGAEISEFDLAASTRVEVPPLAWNVLQSLGPMLTGGQPGNWVASSAVAVDRYLVGLVGLLFAIIGKNQADLADEGRHWLRARTTALIETQFADPRLAADTIAAKLNVSLRSLYRAHEGTLGIAEELRRHRIEHAAALLSDPRYRAMPITEVARRSGFTSITTFERNLHAAYGATPTQLR